jgi:hypothetical protein
MALKSTASLPHSQTTPSHTLGQFHSLRARNALQGRGVVAFRILINPHDVLAADLGLRLYKVTRFPLDETGMLYAAPASSMKPNMASWYGVSKAVFGTGSELGCSNAMLQEVCFVGSQGASNEVGDGVAQGQGLHHQLVKPRGAVQEVWPQLDLHRPVCFARLSVVGVV